MRGEEVLRKIGELNSGGKYTFISWWRREEDWRDYDLLERYVANTKPDEEIEGFELHTTGQMWEHVRKVCGDRIRRVGEEGHEKVVWERAGQTRECPYIPQSLIDIFDIETRGNVVDA